MKKISKKPLRVSYASAVHDDQELHAVSKVIKEHKTGLGENVVNFEKKVAKIFGKKHGIMVNSGSSANLLAFELLNFPEGSEVITPVLTFATTIAPILQKRLIPVLVDADPGTYQLNIDQVEAAITPKTVALMIPSLLGNLPDLARLQRIAKKHKLVFIEDSCDTIGATFNGKPTGSFSDISTTSFYGSHIITAGGGGGLIAVNQDRWVRDLKVLRGWGRSSAVTESEDIDERYKHRIGGLPYDSKFLFERCGYNFLPLEISAAFGLVQLNKLKKFSAIRQKNFNKLMKFFKQYEQYFLLPITGAKVKTNWLAFPLTIKEGAPFTREQFVKFLEKNNIQTRPLFSGNVLRQPGFTDIPSRRLPEYPVADNIMEFAFVIGCHHGMTDAHLAHIQKTVKDFFKTVK